MSERKRFIFPMKVMQWSTLQTGDGQPLNPDSEMKAVGYIPVYENIKTLCDDHGHDAEYGTFEERDAK
jgi:hypothetical protein